MEFLLVPYARAVDMAEAVCGTHRVKLGAGKNDDT